MGNDWFVKGKKEKVNKKRFKARGIRFKGIRKSKSEKPIAQRENILARSGEFGVKKTKAENL